MRLYVIQDIDIDLDQVLAVHRPRIGYAYPYPCGQHLFFKVTMRYLENPITIVYQYDSEERNKWLDEYFKERPSLVRRNWAGLMDRGWLETQRPIFDQMHSDFIKSWEDPAYTPRHKKFV